MKKIFNIMLCSAFLLSLQNNAIARDSTEVREKVNIKNPYKTHERNPGKKAKNLGYDATDQQQNELKQLTRDASIGRAKGGSVVSIGKQVVVTKSMEQETKRLKTEAEQDRISALKKEREDAVHQNHIDGFMNISNAVDTHMQTAHSSDESYSSKYTGSAQLEGASNDVKDSLRKAFGEAVNNITSYANASAVMKAAGGSDGNGAHSSTILKHKSGTSGKTIEEHLSSLEELEDAMKNHELSEEDLKSLKMQHEQEIAYIKEAATSYWKDNGGEGDFWNVAKDDVYFDHATFTAELESHMSENPVATEHYTLHEGNLTHHILAANQNAKSTSNKNE